MERGQHLWLGAHQHGDHRLAGLARDGGERVEQGVLAAEQFKRGGGTGLADQLHHIAHDGDDEVGLARGGDGLVEQGPVNGARSLRSSGAAGRPGRTHPPGRARGR